MHLLYNNLHILSCMIPFSRYKADSFPETQDMRLLCILGCHWTCSFSLWKQCCHFGFVLPSNHFLPDVCTVRPKTPKHYCKFLWRQYSNKFIEIGLPAPVEVLVAPKRIPPRHSPSRRLRWSSAGSRTWACWPSAPCPAASRRRGNCRNSRGSSERPPGAVKREQCVMDHETTW